MGRARYHRTNVHFHHDDETSSNHWDTQECWLLTKPDLKWEFARIQLQNLMCNRENSCGSMTRTLGCEPGAVLLPFLDSRVSHTHTLAESLVSDVRDSVGLPSKGRIPQALNKISTQSRWHLECAAQLLTPH